MRGRKWLPIFVRRANAGVAGIRYLIRGLIVGVVMAAVPVPGYSAIVTVTVGGTVSFGLDQAGLFGVAGADLTGDPFNAVYTFDTGMPGALTISSPTEVAVYGGSSYPAPTPSLGATIEIGGQSQHINGTFVGSTQALITGGQSRQNQVAWDSSGSGGSSISVELLTDVYGGLGVMPLAVDQSFSTGSLASHSYGSFTYFVGGVPSTSAHVSRRHRSRPQWRAFPNRPTGPCCCPGLVWLVSSHDAGSKPGLKWVWRNKIWER